MNLNATSSPGHCNSGDSARLSDGDAAGFSEASSVKNLGELRTLSRASFSDYYYDWIFLHCFNDFLFELENRQ